VTQVKKNHKQVKYKYRTAVLRKQAQTGCITAMGQGIYCGNLAECNDSSRQPMSVSMDTEQETSHITFDSVYYSW
jgi:hypothetical protein